VSTGANSYRSLSFMSDYSASVKKFDPLRATKRIEPNEGDAAPGTGVRPIMLATVSTSRTFIA